MNTPPNSSAVVVHTDTPTHFKVHVAKEYVTMGDLLRKDEYLKFGSDLHEHIVGPVPPDDFLRDLMTPDGMSSIKLPSGLPRLKKIRTEKRLVR